MAGRKPAEEVVLMIATATGTSAWFTAKQACTTLGITPALIRVWESRYGWPCPRRTANGQRRFNTADLDEIRRVLALVRGGRAIGTLLCDGRPHLPDATPRPRLDAGVVSGIPQPARASARALRAELVAALTRRDEGGAQACLARTQRDCTPDDRPWAAWLPTVTLLAAWEAQGQGLGGAPRLRAAVAAQAREWLAQRRPDADDVGVVAADDDVAAIVAAALALAGHPARPMRAQAIAGPYVTVDARPSAGDERHCGHADLLVGPGVAALAAQESGWWRQVAAVG